MLWWDYRKVNQENKEPAEEIVLKEMSKDGKEALSKVYGGTSLEYNSDHSPLKFLVGTEQGNIIQVNKRKTAHDI